MENSLKGLLLAAGTIITCVVISLGFYISREAKDTASGGANQINKLNSEFAQSDKIVYDGAVVSGSEVINVIKKFSNEKIAIYVKTNKASTFYGVNVDINTGEIKGDSTATVADAMNEKSNEYINPYGNFTGAIIKDANDVITGIVFEQ